MADNDQVTQLLLQNANAKHVHFMAHFRLSVPVTHLYYTEMVQLN